MIRDADSMPSTRITCPSQCQLLGSPATSFGIVTSSSALALLKARARREIHTAFGNVHTFGMLIRHAKLPDTHTHRHAHRNTLRTPTFGKQGRHEHHSPRRKGNAKPGIKNVTPTIHPEISTVQGPISSLIPLSQDEYRSTQMSAPAYLRCVSLPFGIADTGHSARLRSGNRPPHSSISSFSLSSGSGKRKGLACRFSGLQRPVKISLFCCRGYVVVSRYFEPLAPMLRNAL